MRLQIILLMSIFGLFLASCVSIQEKPPQVDKNTPEYIYEKAVISMKYNLVDEAIKYLTQALSLDSTHYPSCYLLGVAYYKRGNLVEARATLEKCIQLKPDDPDAHAYLANVYQNLGLGEEAEKEFRKAYVIDESFHASYSLAQLYYEQDKLEPALEYIQKAVQKNNKSASAYNLQGVIQNKLGRYPEAILSFQNAIRNDSKHFVAGVNLGVAYINNKNYDKARELLTHLLSLVQDQPLKDKIMEYLKAIKQLPSPKSTDPAYLS